MARAQSIEGVCLAGQLRRTARAVSRVQDLALAPIGLSAAQFSLLASLIAAASSPDQPVPLGDLARRLAMDRSTLHRNLLPLSEAEFLVVEGRRGRRGSTVTATAKAHDALNRALPMWQACQQTLVATVGEGDSGRLLAALQRLANAEPPI